MTSDFEIGRVVAIDTTKVTVELHSDLKAFTRTTFERAIEVGQINSYLIIPVGARKIVAMVVKVLMTEEAELRTDKTMVTLPSARRMIKATMIGTIIDNEYKQGVNIFPVLDNPVLLANKEDLDAIFGEEEDKLEPTPDDPGYCITIGNSAIFEEYDIRINPDVFFGMHSAILGSTGSGKSCTIASIIQSILENENIKNTNFIILDTNGEYRNAFQIKENGNWKDSSTNYRCLNIPTDPNEEGYRLKIPYWFMNSEDFVRIFQAAPGVQRPILLDALRLAKLSMAPEQKVEILRSGLIIEINRILSYTTGKGKPKSIRQLSEQVLEYLTSNESLLNELASQCDSLTSQEIVNSFQGTKDIVRRNITNEGVQYESYEEIGLLKRNEIEEKLKTILQKLVSRKQPQDQKRPIITVDSPRFFSKVDFKENYLERAMDSQEAGGSRIRDNCATMLMRIYRLFEDQRFDFIFGDTNRDLPEPLHSLATFLRDIFGLQKGKLELSPEEEISNIIFPFYDRQRKSENKSYNIVVLDLSLLASEVLENVTALIGRLILDFLQRISDEKLSKLKRGEFPVVLVLEEAQNYIREPRRNDDESISRDVFERIAREGRKYGLGLVVASQRPSELSRTIISQCNTFIVHRIQNPEDLRYFRDVVPGIYSELLDQLPGLSQRSALVLGAGIRGPSLVQIRNASPIPRSHDPKFYKSWIEDELRTPDVEEVCIEWEGQNIQSDQDEDNNE